jgi:hypothetical protein
MTAAVSWIDAFKGDYLVIVPVSLRRSNREDNDYYIGKIDSKNTMLSTVFSPIQIAA